MKTLVSTKIIRPAGTVYTRFVRVSALRCSSQSGSIAGTFTSVAFLEEPLQVLRGFEPFGALSLLEPFTSGGPQPRAESQALLARLPDETVFVLVRDYQLDSGHWDALSRLWLCVNTLHIGAHQAKRLWPSRPHRISTNSPSVSCSSARMSARIASRDRSGVGL